MLLADRLALISIQRLGLALNVVNLDELLQREACNLALVGCVQIKELAPRMRQAARFRDALRKPCLVAAEVITD